MAEGGNSSKEIGLIRCGVSIVEVIHKFWYLATEISKKFIGVSQGRNGRCNG